MGVAQHHDAVSGTEKQEVAFDYAQRLSVGVDSAVVSIRMSPSARLSFKHQCSNILRKSFSYEQH